jgi:uncharacterized membrane protein
MILWSFYIIVIAATPIVELRGAIPIALAFQDFPIWLAFSLAVIGNMIPPLLLIPFLGKADAVLSKHSKLWRRVFSHFLEKTRADHGRKFVILKDFALIILVAIPLPLTGAWTASLAAYLFGIPFRRAIPLIFVGILIAGTIVTLATLGAITIFVP